MNNAILLAVGGNSLIRAGEKGTIPEQFANARATARAVADIVTLGYDVVVTHGNGPQVGSQLLRSEAGSSQTYTMPLDVCVAATQGEIGYILQTSFQSELRERRIRIPVVAFVTQVLVDAHDPAFRHPTKPVGPFYSKEAAERKRAELGWDIVDDAARGYRRVVPSPKPKAIIELEAIRDALDRGMLVIAAGGGGIPVVVRDGELSGIEAVIDKDRASALLAGELRIPTFVISTDVPLVYRNFRQANEEAIRWIDAPTLRRELEGYPAGSMRPKLEAAVDFLDRGGREVIITNPDNLAEALEGRAGTHITTKELYEAVTRD